MCVPERSRHSREADRQAARSSPPPARSSHHGSGGCGAGVLLLGLLLCGRWMPDAEGLRYCFILTRQANCHKAGPCWLLTSPFPLPALLHLLSTTLRNGANCTPAAQKKKNQGLCAWSGTRTARPLPSQCRQYSFHSQDCDWRGGIYPLSCLLHPFGVSCLRLLLQRLNHGRGTSIQSSCWERACTNTSPLHQACAEKRNNASSPWAWAG